ncbi:alginate lyase family protein [Actinoplanes aureus]|uniref:Alginate lyase family protein n=1 Tax=Actinoplanes aureus TaxID=2792083 RepID=A0A931FY32_9ACTN|nr:alginate lyase family protein [Actinoplanes aureus]MBG0564163.1 alginate lyase family protein [Actinoplanes aureus]
MARRLSAVLAGVTAAALLAAGVATADAGTTTVTAKAAGSGFAHPGVLVSRGQLDFVKAKVRAGAQPWKKAYDAMMASPSASLGYTPTAYKVVQCGPYSNPDVGCGAERRDAFAAYTLALAWYLTGDERYAKRAIVIMDAWSGTITAHTNSNDALQSSWSASVWPRAAEIIKHAYRSWPNSARFATMLRKVYLPMAQADRSSWNGNWELTQIEAAVSIAVHLDDRTLYDKTVARFRKRVPAYIYLASDGALPKPPPGTSIDTRAEIVKYWYGQTTFVDGISQETCRDFTHTGYGVAAISHIAETSRIQGRDLYPEVRDRLRHAMGFLARHATGNLPSWLCGGKVDNRWVGPVTEVGFNALHNRMGVHMPATEKLTVGQRPTGNNNLMSAWETLTHAENRA